MLVLDGKQMQLLLNVGGPDRVSRVQMAETVARVRGYETSIIKPVSASSVRMPSQTPFYLQNMFVLALENNAPFWHS